MKKRLNEKIDIYLDDIIPYCRNKETRDAIKEYAYNSDSVLITNIEVNISESCHSDTSIFLTFEKETTEIYLFLKLKDFYIESFMYFIEDIIKKRDREKIIIDYNKQDCNSIYISNPDINNKQYDYTKIYFDLNENKINFKEAKEKIWKNVKEIIQNGNTVIINWSDGTKSITRCQEGDEFDIYVGVSLALVKKIFGSNHQFRKLIKKRFIKKY